MLSMLTDLPCKSTAIRSRELLRNGNPKLSTPRSCRAPERNKNAAHTQGGASLALGQYPSLLPGAPMDDQLFHLLWIGEAGGQHAHERQGERYFCFHGASLNKPTLRKREGEFAALLS